MKFKEYINESLFKKKHESEMFFSRMDGRYALSTRKLTGNDVTNTAYDVSNYYWTEDPGVFKVMKIKASDLIPTQEMVFVDALRGISKYKNITVVIYKNKKYVVDGHHNLALHILNKKTIICDVYSTSTI